MSRERRRDSRRTSARHSNLLANGRGDPRDGRRENQRLTERDLDPAALRIKDGRITLVEDPKGLAADALKPLADQSGGAKSETAVGSLPTLAAAPATATDLRDDIEENLVPALKAAIATLAAKVNALIERQA